MALPRISSNAARSSLISRFVLLLVLFLSAFICDGRCVAQQTGQSVIRGGVNYASGSPVSDAIVRLRRPDSETAVAETKTNAQGHFELTGLPPGKYFVLIEKGGVHSSASISTGDEEIRLTFPAVPARGRVESMDFADRPDFTVAGITDWTAVGGHGSDASLRTSESLARRTATLKPDELMASASTLDPKNESELRSAVAASPESFETNRALGQYYLRKRNYREAQPPLEVAYRIHPDDRGNEYDLALSYKETGDPGRAHEHVSRLLTTEDTADLHRLAGDVDEAMGDALAAAREYETAVRLDPSELNEFTWGAELLLHRAVWPAVEVFRRGTASYPKSARMLAALGASLFASAQYSEAAQRLCEASDLNPEETAPYLFLGETEIAGPVPFACAEEKLSRFAQLHPENPQAQYYWAMAILKGQIASGNSLKIEHARALLGAAVKFDPKYGEAYVQLGILSSNKKDYAQAIEYFNQAIKANPLLGDAHYRLGVVYQRIGEEAKAKQEFERHREIEGAQAASVEKQREQIKQFVVVLQGDPARPK